MASEVTDPIEELQQAAEDRWVTGWLAGPTWTRYEELPAQPGDEAPDLELPDTSGGKRRLSEFWAYGPALVIFMRHFGCSCLMERWEALKDELDAFTEAGATVVAVCQAEPERAAAVATRRGYRFPLLCDPDRTAYRAFGLLEGTPAQILHDFPWRPNDMDTAQTMFCEPRRGTERAVVDSPWQLPGEFVVAVDGRIQLAHRYQYCEDFPPKTVLLGAIAAAQR
ncbi:MAG TPA: peroxiredoxin-like family protein [Candidatus Limnocylindria bacterium]|jgi:peroxiredoxin|nr:peroxiredoxin-like family protein [Candidatus Limnocylindria bacterium]